MRLLLTLLLGFLCLSAPAQTLEGLLQEWLADAPNGFQNVFQKYGRQGNGLYHDIDAIGYTTTPETRRYYVYFEMKVEGSLEDTYEKYREKVMHFDFLRGWAKDKPPHLPGITFRQGRGDQNYAQFGLQLHQNYDGTKGRIVSLWIARACSFCTANTPDKNTLPPPRSNPYSIIELLKSPKGKQALEALFADAEHDFENIIDERSFKNGVYQLKPHFLNPKAPFPFIYVTEAEQRRTLVIRLLQPTEKKRYVTMDLLNDPDFFLKNKLALDWTISTEGGWSAVPKLASESYKKLHQAFDSYGDHLELTVIKRPYRQQVPGFQMAGPGKCLSGNCRKGFGVMSFRKGTRRYRYEGEFKDGLFEGLGVLYDLTPGQAANDFGQEIPEYIGRFVAGEKAGKKSRYRLEPIPNYRRNMDPHHQARRAGEYLRPEDQTTAGSYEYYWNTKEGRTIHEQVHFLHHQLPGGRTIVIDKPFARPFGECLSGDCENGEGVLRLEGIGEFRGKFVDGLAYLTGLLTIETGEVFSVWVEFGFPKRFRTVVLPQGVSRMNLARRRVWRMTEFDCLEGNCWNGRGKQLFGYADRFEESPIEEAGLTGYLEADFQRGRPGYGTLYPFDHPGMEISGNFKNDLDGDYTVKYRGRTETWHFQTNRLVRKSSTGQ